jgi:hypothetical protein
MNDTLDYSTRIAIDPSAENNGLAQMVAGLITQNLQERPDKRPDFARIRGRVAIVAEDAGVAMTLDFRGDALTVHDGIAGIPDVAVRADADDIIQMSLLELTRRWALPNLFADNARAIMKKSQSGRVRVYGALLHMPLMLRLARLLSVH